MHVITSKLVNALKLEDFEVDLFNIDHGAVNPFVHDLRLVIKLKDYDFIIYSGSVARISSLLAGRVLLYLFMDYYLMNTKMRFCTAKLGQG